MISSREFPSATLLSNGNVLITGGYGGVAASTDTLWYLNTAEIYDPSTGIFTPTGNMTSTRGLHTATLLSEGTVLIVGGTPIIGGGYNPISTVEIYDPLTGNFAYTGNTNFDRIFEHTATLLLNGTVLIAGGEDNCGGTLNTAEIYDPSTRTFTSATPNTFTMTPSAGAGGTIDPSTPQIVNYNSCGAVVKITPTTGYYIDSVTGCGINVSGNTNMTGERRYRIGWNTDNCTVTATFKISDATPPVTTASVTPSPNGSGWNNSNVTVTLTSADDPDGSGVQSITYTLSGAQTGSGSVSSNTVAFPVSAEGITNVSYYAQDNAGNPEATKTLPLRIDYTPPVVTFGTTCPTTAILNSSANVTVTVSDALSGVAMQSAPNGTNALKTATLATNTFTVTAQDNAGNNSYNSCTYRVIYDFAGAGGFQAPINNPPVLNTAKAGSAIPVKWQLPNGQGGFISDLGAVTSIQFQQVSCSDVSSTLTDPVEAVATGNSGLHYDYTTNQYIFNWSTLRSWAGSCYNMVLSLNDGSQYEATFLLK